MIAMTNEAIADELMWFTEPEYPFPWALDHWPTIGDTIRARRMQEVVDGYFPGDILPEPTDKHWECFKNELKTAIQLPD